MLDTVIITEPGRGVRSGLKGLIGAQSYDPAPPRPAPVVYRSRDVLIGPAGTIYATAPRYLTVYTTEFVFESFSLDIIVGLRA